MFCWENAFNKRRLTQTSKKIHSNCYHVWIFNDIKSCYHLNLKHIKNKSNLNAWFTLNLVSTQHKINRCCILVFCTLSLPFFFLQQRLLTPYPLTSFTIEKTSWMKAQILLSHIYSFTIHLKEQKFVSFFLITLFILPTRSFRQRCPFRVCVHPLHQPQLGRSHAPQPRESGGHGWHV